MKEFQLISSKQYWLPGNNNGERWLHVATIGKGIREYMFFVDAQRGVSYVEEITGGNLIQISDDNLWNDITSYIQSLGLNKFLASS